MIKKLKLGGMTQRIAAVVIGIAVLSYTVYHISSLFGEDITTLATGVSTEKQVIDAKGYVFRDETVLYSANSGVVDYMVSDGDKLSVSDDIATVYSIGDEETKKLLRSLDKKIAILEKSVNSGKSLADLPKIKDDISDSYYEIAKLLASSDTGSLRKQMDKLLLSMNCHSLLTDPASPVKQSLDFMNSQRNSILANGGNSVKERASDSGYFYSYVDGYEQSFTLLAADELTAEKYHSLVSSTAEQISPNAYGKFAVSSDWKFVIKMSDENADNFTLESTYNMEFVENGNTIIPMTLSAVIDDTVESGKIFVFSANRLPAGFDFSRSQSVSVEVSSVSGLYVPKHAAHRSGRDYYVYILRGSVVCYRKIEVIYEGSDYFLCNTDPEYTGGTEYLGTNELLIVSGNNLFDGRILD